MRKEFSDGSMAIEPDLLGPASMGRVRVSDLLADELRPAEPPQDDLRIVYWTYGEAIAMTPEQWRCVLDERARLGRVMTRIEVMNVLRANGSHDAHR